MRSKIDDDGSWLQQAQKEEWRAEAYLSRFQFSPHAHDRYAIGITMRGVQQFDYRGVTRNSLPGQVVVLHPDELHDGRAGTDEGFRYRALYLDPVKVQNLSRHDCLPFIEGGVCADPRLVSKVRSLLDDLSTPLGQLEEESLISDLVEAMHSVSQNSQPKRKLDRVRIDLVAKYIRAHYREDVQLETLEQVSGISRWDLCRDFRSCFGTSPHRYLIMRRLDHAMYLIKQGLPGAKIAAMVGFADQSHLIRHFKRAFGLTPNAWRKLIGCTNVLFFE